ncbi:hypothetical protein VDG1235_4345 [Verrucomicrobiia bacterium DG1235]|nr:hypothetical protein VDG1235_4345 [Verrucomicrobiae bacterium DG1235]
MNKNDREAIFRNGGLIREGWDWLDFSVLLLVPALFGWCAYLWRDDSKVVLFTILAVAFIVPAVICHFRTGRLHKVSDRKPHERKEIENELGELGYRAIDKGSYFLEMVRDIEYTKNVHHIVLFWWDQALYGYSWMSSGRFHRMPFVTGDSEITRIKRKLTSANQTVLTTPDAARPTS